MAIKVRSLAIGFLVAAVLPLAFWLIARDYEAVAYDAGNAPAAPEFTHRQADEWTNSPPLSLAVLLAE